MDDDQIRRELRRMVQSAKQEIYDKIGATKRELAALSRDDTTADNAEAVAAGLDEAVERSRQTFDEILDYVETSRRS